MTAFFLPDGFALPTPKSAFTRPETREIPDDWPVAFTDNNVRIVPGLRVRDYNWRETVVSERTPTYDGGEWDEENNCRVPGTGTPWFYTANGGTFDGSRLFAL